MAERAHPDLPGFQHKWKFRLRKGLLPWFEFELNPYREALFWRYKWVSSFCKGQDVLDIPCGVGWGTALIRNARTVVGVDIIPEVIAEAKVRYRKPLFCVGNMIQLPFSDSTFDIIACLEGIEHVSENVGASFVADAARVLRPDGKLFISSPYCITGGHSGNPYHIKEYSLYELTNLLKPHFIVLDTVVRHVDNLDVYYIHASKRTK